MASMRESLLADTRSASEDEQALDVIEAATETAARRVEEVTLTPSLEAGGTSASPSVVCCWKACKKVPKEGTGEAVRLCEKAGCGRVVHGACSAAMLALFKADIGFSKVACGKRCYNALMKNAQKPPPITTKKRVPWHNDGPTPDVSSLGVLLDWITTGNNYDRYRGGERQTGDTKTTIAGEIASKIAAAGITTTRTPKDITNKIASLETTFRSAEDWLSNTGQGCDEKETSIRNAILLRCSNYFELRDTMSARPSTRPQLLNTDPDASKDDTEDDEEGSSDDESKSSESSNGKPQSKRPASTPRRIAHVLSKRSRKCESPQPASMIKLKEAQLAQNRELQLMELEVRKKKVLLQEQEWRARKQQMENEARAIDAGIDEANTQTLKLRQEAELKRQQRKIELLRERKKLQEEGIANEDIDLLLPLTTYF